MPKKLTLQRLAGSSWRWCSREKTGRPSRLWSTMEPLPRSIRRPPSSPGIGCHYSYHQVCEPLLALLRWTPLRCMQVTQWRHQCPKYQNHCPYQPMHVLTWWDQGDAEDNGTLACSEVPQGLGLDLAARPVQAHLQGPSHSLPAAQVPMQAVLKGQGDGLSPPYLLLHCHPLSIPHSLGFPHSPSVTNMATPTP